MMGRRWLWIALAIAATTGLAAVTAQGGTVGDIQGIYNAPSSFNFNGSFNGGLSGTPIGIQDGAVFVIENNSATAFTNVIFSIGVGGDNGTADSFNVGTIAANSYVTVAPGVSNDGGAGHTFFAVLGGVRDESDVGPNSSDVPFRLTGLMGTTLLDTGIFTPAATAGLSNDGSTTTNFLGINDGPCNNCFGPKVIADINTQSPGTTPEPATAAGAGLALLAAIAVSWRRRLRAASA